nr:immunoglobulin light chain junction region [Macaca mulatta]
DYYCQVYNASVFF